MSTSKLISLELLLPGVVLQALLVNAAQSAEGNAPPANAAASGGLEEIVVTAARREESQSKVAVSITAFTQKTLDDNTVRTVDDLAKLTPGVSFSRTSDASGSVANISIRGISSDAGSGATGIYIDDTPIQSRASVSGLGSSVWPQIFDLERVEILRGPQGTLFGAGSEGGTVRLITPQPSTTKFDAYARSDVAFTRGGDPSTEAGAALNVPLIDGVLGVRLSASYRHDGGFVNRVDYLTGNVEQANSNYANTSTARLALAYKPWDSLTITPSLYWQDQYVNDSAVYWMYLSDPGQDNFNRSSTIPNTSHDRFSLPSLKVEWAMSGATLTSNTSYFERNQPSVQNLAAFESAVWANLPYPPALPPTGVYAPSFDDIHQRNFTQEIRLQSQDSAARLTWLAGLFYQHSWQHVHQRVQDTFLPELYAIGTHGGNFEQDFGVGLYQGLYTVLIDPFNTVDRQMAAFGQVDFKITEQLKATVGLRYAKIDSSAYAFYAGPIIGVTPRDASGSTSEKPVTPKFGLSYQVNDGTLLYTSATKGYRDGGYNNPVPVNCGVSTTGTPIPGTDLGSVGLVDRPAKFQSDSLWSYEIGSKSRELNNRLSIDTSLYYIKWKDIQFSYNLPQCGFSFTTNAGNATSKGFEISLQARPVPALELGASLGYINAKYDRTTYFLGNPIPGAKAVTGGGDVIQVSPWTASLIAQWSFPVLDHEAYVRANYNYSDSLNHNLPVMDARTGGYDPDIPGLPVMNDLSLKLGTNLGPVNAALYINNATNQHPVLGVQHAVVGDPLFLATTVRPRTIGITASYRY